MMGFKERAFAPLVAVSLEALVPQDHFYRHLDRTLDLSFVRDVVQNTYASLGRPSIDPVVFFRTLYAKDEKGGSSLENGTLSLASVWTLHGQIPSRIPSQVDMLPP